MGKPVFKAINISLPQWLVEKLDQEAIVTGISRKALINILLVSLIRGKKNNELLDVGYLHSIEKSFAEEWESPEDEEAFDEL